MRTAVIWNDFEELQYAIVDGDLSKFNGIYVNMIEPEDFEPKGTYDDLAEEMFNTLENVEFCPIDEFASAIRDGAVVIECGFLL